MIRYLLTVACCFAVSKTAIGEDGLAGDAGAAATLLQRSRREQIHLKSSARPWVWEVASGSARAWVCGGLHLGTGRSAPVLPLYLPYYAKATVVYFETIPGSWDTFETKQFVGQNGFVPDRRALSSVVAKETWQELTSYLAPMPERLATISRMQPWYAALTLTQDGYAAAGLKAEHSLESFIERLAIDERKPVGGIESPKDQIIALANAPEADQEQFLLKSLQSAEQYGLTTRAIEDAWAKGDENALRSALGLGSWAEGHPMQQDLIVNRNRRWVKKMQEILQRGKAAFILVGIEHLIADSESLPALMERQGFSCQRLGGSEKSRVAAVIAGTAQRGSLKEQ